MIAFLLLFTLLQLGWQGVQGTVVQWIVVHDLTVRPAAALVNGLTPALHARAVKYSIVAPGGGLNILNGCEGVEALFLLAAAFLVAPISWRSRAIGFLIGTAVLFVVNQVRILTLFYSYRADAALFDTLHGTVTPIAVIVLVCCYFYAWLAYSGRAVAAAG